MKRKVEEPTKREHGEETHPSWGMIAASRVQGTPRHLFDSDVRHMHTRSPCGSQRPEAPPEERLAETASEVQESAEKALAHVLEKLEAVEEKPNKGNIRALRLAVEGVPRNLKFAADSLSEHTENVVQKARADIEAIAAAKAQQLGIEPGDLGGPATLMPGDDDTG